MYIAEDQFVKNQVVRHHDRVMLNHTIREMVNKVENLLSQDNSWTRERVFYSTSWMVARFTTVLSRRSTTY